MIDIEDRIRTDRAIEGFDRPIRTQPARLQMIQDVAELPQATQSAPAAPAARTAFIHEKVSLCGGAIEFVVDGNSKITRDNGTFAHPKPNAFGLPHVSTCPGSTPICRSGCYVHGLQKHAPEVYATYQQNERNLHLAIDRRPNSSAHQFALWISEHCPGGFRWHVSGDIMSLAHAIWISRVVRDSQPVQHWIYTRTLWALETLVRAQLPNLSINISCDAANYRDAQVYSHTYGLRLCYLSSKGEVPDDLPKGSVIFPDYPQRGRDLPDPFDLPWWRSLPNKHRAMVCPADFFGQSNVHRCGPCRKCL